MIFNLAKNLQSTHYQPHFLRKAKVSEFVKIKNFVFFFFPRAMCRKSNSRMVITKKKAFYFRRPYEIRGLCKFFFFFFFICMTRDSNAESNDSSNDLQQCLAKN